ncbi:hypothetical protein D3C78_1713460 [compost metagenome]
MFPAVGAAAHHQFGKAATFQRPQALADLARVEVHHRFAAGLLVAGQYQGVEGQRVGLGIGGLFLDQRAEDAGFRAIEPWFFSLLLFFDAHRAFPMLWKPPSLILAQ